jgi:hypothetical protein
VNKGQRTRLPEHARLKMLVSIPDAFGQQRPLRYRCDKRTATSGQGYLEKWTVETHTNI